MHGFGNCYTVAIPAKTRTNMKNISSRLGQSCGGLSDCAEALRCETTLAENKIRLYKGDERLTFAGTRLYAFSASNPSGNFKDIEICRSFFQQHPDSSIRPTLITRPGLRERGLTPFSLKVELVAR